jgi:hypothetical protein
VLSASVESISRDLVEYGENDSALWMMACSEDDLVRVCSVADWLLLHGPTAPSGASMIIAKACALAAVYVREGAPRELRHSRRRKVEGLPPVPTPGRRPDHQLQAGSASLRRRRRRKIILVDLTPTAHAAVGSPRCILQPTWSDQLSACVM